MDIEKAYEELIKAAEAGNTERVVLLELPAAETSWIQLTWDAFNAAYPFVEPPPQPLERLGLALPPDFEVVAWEPATYVTFEHGSPDSESVGRFTRQYIALVFGLTPDQMRLTQEDL